ncbi:MAG: MarR family transcriptional regulator [Candidatus Limnocylindrales bacterium]
MRTTSEPTADVIAATIAELASLIRQQRRHIIRHAIRSHVSMTHHQVLMVLDAEGPLPMHRVAESLTCSMPNVSGIIDRMIDRGLVERERDDNDRRVVMVTITQAGRLALEETDSMRQKHFQRILSAMSERDQRLCLRAIRRMRETAERLDALPSLGGTLA